MINYNLNIVKYSEQSINEWDNFVNNSNNGTIFHTQTFLKYHEEGKFQFTSYMIYNNNELVAILPGGFKENKTIYWSPIGASYGSIVTNDISFELSLAIIDFIINFFKKNGTKDIFFIPPPLIYSKIYNQNIEYAMLFRKFDFEYHYISHAIDLNQPLFQTYNRKTRYKIRNAKSNPELSITEVENFDDFYPILMENKRKHNAVPTHSLNDLAKLKELLPNNINQFNLYHNKTAIAGTTMFKTNSQVALCFYNMLNYDYEKLYPAYLIIDFVINWAKNNGFKWFDFGVSQDTAADNPMTPSLPLIYFKEMFNSRGIFRSTYHFAL